MNGSGGGEQNNSRNENGRATQMQISDAPSERMDARVHANRCQCRYRMCLLAPFMSTFAPFYHIRQVSARENSIEFLHFLMRITFINRAGCSSGWQRYYICESSSSSSRGFPPFFSSFFSNFNRINFSLVRAAVLIQFVHTAQYSTKLLTSSHLPRNVDRLRATENPEKWK